MTPPIEWQEWLSEGMYRIRIAPAAMTRLRPLPEGIQERLRRMLTDIAGIADSQPPSASGRGWRAGRDNLLHLSLGRISVRYSIDEAKRTLTVEHVVVPDDLGDLGQTG